MYTEWSKELKLIYYPDYQRDMDHNYTREQAKTILATFYKPDILERILDERYVQG